MNVKFTKMQVLGNDFIIVNCLKEKCENPNELARALCRRYYSIGANSMMLVLPGKRADFRMRLFNSDGSEAETGGNELMAFTRYVFLKKITGKKKIRIETLAGISDAEILDGNIRVDMGEPVLDREKIPMKGKKGKVIDEPLKLEEKTVRITAISVGNPHAVVFVDTFNFSIGGVGSGIEGNERFPNRVNVEFVQVVNKKEVNVQQWDRGAGITLSTGTGACATAVAGVLNKKTERKITVHFIGGDMGVEWAENNHLYILGKAELVFEGEISRS